MVKERDNSIKVYAEPQCEKRKPPEDMVVMR